MRQALNNAPLSTLSQPPGIVNVRIDATTGLLAPAGDTNTLFELFRSDDVPTQYGAGTPTAPTPEPAADSGSGSTTAPAANSNTTDDGSAPLF